MDHHDDYYLDKHGELVVDHRDVRHVDRTADWDVDHLHDVHHPRHPHSHPHVHRDYDDHTRHHEPVTHRYEQGYAYHDDREESGSEYKDQKRYHETFTDVPRPHASYHGEEHVQPVHHASQE